MLQKSFIRRFVITEKAPTFLKHYKLRLLLAGLGGGVHHCLISSALMRMNIFSPPPLPKFLFLLPVDGGDGGERAGPGWAAWCWCLAGVGTCVLLSSARPLEGGTSHTSTLPLSTLSTVISTHLHYL